MLNLLSKLTLLGLLVSFIFQTEVDAQSKIDLSWESSVGANVMPPKEKFYWVNDYGVASRPDLMVNTKAIQAAIDDCSKKGGGIVAFKPGIYLTGALFLKENVNLKIDKGVELWAIQDVDYFPEMESRIAGIEMTWPSALINVIGKNNVAITGEGVINAQGRFYWEKYWNMRTNYDKKGLRWIVDYDCKRVRTLLVSDSKNVTINDLTLLQAGFWTVHLLYSENVTVNGITIRNNIEGMGPSTDGIDIDSSSKILIENCDIDCHDDNFCLKSGRDADGLRVNRPTEYVVIRNCISRVGSGMVTIGSETSGSIRKIYAYNNKALGTSSGIKLKSALTRGGIIEDIYFKNNELDGVGRAISVELNWNPSYSYSELPEGYNIDSVPHHWKVMLEKVEPEEKGIPKFKNVVIENLKGTNVGTAIYAGGNPKSTLDDFVLKNIEIDCKNPGSIKYADKWLMDEVILKDSNNEKLLIEDCRKMKIKKLMD